MKHYNSDIPDPLLSPEYFDEQIDRMREIRNRIARQQTHQDQPQTNQNQKNVWDEIREEIEGLSDTQRRMLFADEDYKRNDEAIAEVAARYQIQVLMPYVLGDQEGKNLLERQLHLIRAKKDSLKQAEEEELEAFRVWREERKKNKKTS